MVELQSASLQKKMAAKKVRSNFAITQELNAYTLLYTLLLFISQVTKIDSFCVYFDLRISLILETIFI